MTGSIDLVGVRVYVSVVQNCMCVDMDMCESM